MDCTATSRRQTNRTSLRPWCRLAGTLSLLTVAAVVGCRSAKDFRFNTPAVPPAPVATDIETPTCPEPTSPEMFQTPAPQTVMSQGEVQYWPLKLEEAVRIALDNSRVMRDLGGRVLSSPTNTPSVFDPAIRESDPVSGPEAALSAFDAGFNTELFWAHNDLAYNSILQPEGVGGIQQNVGVFRAEIAKTAATGTRFWIRNSTIYYDTDPLLRLLGNNLNTAYSTQVSVGFRQPLLQGAGIEFNRIAGPNARPGMYDGVLIARINTDVTLADFEMGVRTLLWDVEQTYWQLYRAYRDLDARSTARQSALETWQLIERRLESGATDREQEAHAREQYYAFDAQVINSLNGMQVNAEPGAPTGGGAVGVLSLERRLRWLMGLPPSDGRTIRPADAPADVRVIFDWSESLQDTLTRRVELRRQRWMIKRRELELIAARNFLHMRLDFTGQYGWSGFGDDLIGSGSDPHSSAVTDLFSGDTQQWQTGLSLTTPIGNRIGHTSVRNAELLLCRERAVYREQELRAVHELSDAMGNVDRSFAVARAAFNSFIAAHQTLEQVRKKYESGLVPLDFLLDAQRRAVEADSAFHQATVEYSIGIANVHLARGTLLAYNNVFLNEGAWSADAEQSALKESRRFAPRILNYVYVVPERVSQGRYAQGVVCPTQQEPPAAAPQPTPAPQPTVAPPPQQAEAPAVDVQWPVWGNAVASPSGLQQPTVSQQEVPVRR